MAEMTEALRESRGFVSAAARRLACDAQTVYNYMERYPELKEIRKEAKEAEKDLAEMMLGKMIRDGQFPATCFFLKTQARDRGYVERQEHEISGNDSRPVKVTFKLDRPNADDVEGV